MLEAVYTLEGKLDGKETVEVSVFRHQLVWEKDGEVVGAVPLGAVEAVMVDTKLFRRYVTIVTPDAKISCQVPSKEVGQIVDEIDTLVRNAKRRAAPQDDPRAAEIRKMMAQLRGKGSSESLLTLMEWHKEGKLTDKEYTQAQINILGV